jgi:ABC-type transport system involved in multi-copper enzyme maturation permease subunit
MKAMTLLRIEWIKTTRRRAFWVTLGFFSLVCTMMIVGDVATGRRGFGPPFVAPFGWARAADQFESMPAFFLSIVVVMLVASEFSWRTARQNVIDGLSKEQFFAAKTLMLLLVVVAFTVVPFALAASATVYSRIVGPPPPREVSAAPDSAAIRAAMRAGSGQNRDSAQAAMRDVMRAIRDRAPVFPPPDPDAPFVTAADGKVFGGFVLGSLGIASVAFMLAATLRSTGGAIGTAFLYFMVVERAILLLLTRFTSADTVRAVQPYLPMNAFAAPMRPAAWHAAYVERMSVGRPSPVVDADLFHLIGVPLLWIAVFIGIAFLDFRRRDL